MAQQGQDQQQQQQPGDPQQQGAAAGNAAGGNLVVRVDQNSESDLQALFDSVLKPDSKRPLQVPLRMRNLPDSFFNPPSTGSKSPSISHSRENSADSAFGSIAAAASIAVGPASVAASLLNGVLQQQQQANGASSSGPNSSAGSSSGTTSPAAVGGGSGAASIPPGLVVAHPRAHSSPASLQQTYASAQQQAQHAAPQPHSAARHVHHQKQRSYDVISTVDDLGPLPHGWEQARTPEGQIYFLK
ncbi:hypothetical protein QAD02_000850 [Eretmocerus hayati]|uniref:Uncharacterized protein n=1 Tax=Eretmocerus hayati TaxID=131215 RepID=A0ACC2NES2_9HYME|nr:hypothetical protein QAD02_000850 [Eretmocerus hayati]